MLFSRRCLTLIAFAAGAASAHATSLHQELVQAQQALASGLRVSTPTRAWTDQADAQIERLDALMRAVGSDDPLYEKADQLRRMTQFLRNRPDGLAKVELPEPVPTLRMPGARADTCESALRLPEGTAQKHTLSAGESVWFRVEAQPGSNLLLSTRGSNLDTRLSAFLDCRVKREEPLTSSDDTIGLQAEVALQQRSQSFWLARLDNVGTQSGEAVVSAVRAAIVSGTVLRDEDSQPLADHRVSAHESVSGNMYYLGSWSTDSLGQYSIALNYTGAFAFRTGNWIHGLANVIDEAWDNVPCRSRDEYAIYSCGSAELPVTLVPLTDTESRTLDFRLSTAPSVAGLVTTAGTGVPLPNAWVSITGSEGNTLWAGNTDAAGRYRSMGLPAATVFVRAGADGYRPQLFDGIDCGEPNGCTPQLGTPIALQPAQTRQVNFQLEASPRLQVNLLIAGRPASFEAYSLISLLNSNGSVIRVGAGNGASIVINNLQPGTYRVRAFSTHGITQLYEGVDCASDCIAELGLAEPIVVQANTVGPALTMNLTPLPVLSGLVTRSSDGMPLPNARLTLVPVSGGQYETATTDSLGRYAFPPALAGTYLLTTQADGMVGEVYDNIACASGSPQLDCPGATLITFDRQSTNRVIDVDLESTASVRGTIRLNRVSPVFGFTTLYAVNSNGVPVQGVNVTLWPDGRYEAVGFLSGSYRLAMFSNQHVPQLYRGVDCPGVYNGSSFSNCNLAAAQVVELVNGNVTEGIDFSLTPILSRPVRVVSASSGQPLPNVAIDLWDGGNLRADTQLTDADGRAWLRAQNSSNPSMHYLSTFNTLGLVDQVYQDRLCPAGSAFFGQCSLSGASPVVMPPVGTVQPIEFRLGDLNSIFGHGFEP